MRGVGGVEDAGPLGLDFAGAPVVDVGGHVQAQPSQYTCRVPQRAALIIEAGGERFRFYDDMPRGGMMARSHKPGPIEMKVVAERIEDDAEASELISRLEAEADREIAAGTVTLRWGKRQIAVVKRAAAILGVPYQTYLKQVVFRQAMADIQQGEAVMAARPRS